MIDIRYFEHRSQAERLAVKDFLSLPSTDYNYDQGIISALEILLGKQDRQLDVCMRLPNGNILQIAAQIRTREMKR